MTLRGFRENLREAAYTRTRGHRTRTQMAKHKLTDAFIAHRVAEAPDLGRHRVFYDDHKDAPRGFGVRVTKNGAVSFVLNYYAGGAERRATVNAKGERLSITAARKRAQVMRDRINVAGDPLRERQAERQAKAAAVAEARRKRDLGLGALLAAYVDHLRSAGKPSAREVEGAAKRHIFDPFPRLAAKPADEVTVEDVMPVFHGLAKAGKFREAEKLRTYLRAAFTAARKARTDAAMHAFVGFQIRYNPLDDLAVTRPKEAALDAAQAAKERKWALSEAQLAAYWGRIQALPAPHGSMLRLHLLTGGQRVKQLSRLERSNLDEDTKTVTLFDSKGRRQVAYEHVVPLLPEAEQAIEEMRGLAGPYLFSVSRGKDGAVYHTLRDAMLEVAQAMVEAGEVHQVFTPGTIRKTVETRLAAAGVGKDIRARLQSHGIGGVQDKHYDAHDYDAEKRAALRKLRVMCEGSGGARVVELDRRRGR